MRINTLQFQNQITNGPIRGDDIDFAKSNLQNAVLNGDQDRPPSMAPAPLAIPGLGVPPNMRYVDPIELIYKSDEQRYFKSGVRQHRSDDPSGNLLISCQEQQQRNRTAQE